MTALTATFSAVTARLRTGSTPTRWSGWQEGGQARHGLDRLGAVGGTIGSPSVQPRSWKCVLDGPEVVEAR